MGRGIAVRIALAALASAAVGLAILAIGVTVGGADIFTALMVDAGEPADHARAMYDQSVTVVVIAAVGVAAAASIVLAVLLARMLARPLAEVGAAARRVAEGDYAARVPREGPDELLSLAERHQLLHEWNLSIAGDGQGLLLLCERFEAQAALRPPIPSALAGWFDLNTDVICKSLRELGSECVSE